MTGEQIATAIDAGARRIHVDIMDGHFVPNLSFGPGMVSALAPPGTVPPKRAML